MDRRINRNFLISLFLVNIIPVFGYIWSLLNINRNNARLMLFIICIFDFFLAIKVPPYQDLFRRYTETYYSYFPGITLQEALENKIDILFYMNSWFFYKLRIPFFYIPALYSALTIYSIYSSYLILLKNRLNNDLYYKTSRFLISSLVIISAVNIIGIATTLRFGLAASLMIKAIVLVFNNERKKGITYIILSILMHASMLIPLSALLASRFIKINRITSILGCFISILFSTVLMRYVLTHFSLFGLSNYFLVGYVDSVWSSFSTDISTLFFITVQYSLAIFFLSKTMKKSQENPGFDNFINIFLIVCFLLTISVTVFNRFFNGIALILLMYRYFLDLNYINRSWLVKYFCIGIIFYNMIFINVYVQRRPIMLGSMYTALYTPPMFNAFYTMDDFNGYLRKINAKGDWIGHELGK